MRKVHIFGLKLWGSIVLLLTLNACENQTVAPTANSFKESTTPYLAGVKEFHWATDAAFDEVALRLRFQLPEDETSCVISQLQCFHMDDFGLSSWQVTTTESMKGAGGWSAQRGGDFVVIGPVDTRLEHVVDQMWCVDTHFGTNVFSGLLEHHSFGTQLMPVEREGGPPVSMAISLECEAAFDVLPAAIGPEARLYWWDTLDAMGANQELLGNVLIGSAQDVLHSAQAGYFTGHSGAAEAALVQVDGPDGRQSHTQMQLSGLTMEGLAHHMGGPGTYDIQVQRLSAAGRGTWWLLAYGLAGPLDLGPGLLSESAISR